MKKSQVDETKFIKENGIAIDDLDPALFKVVGAQSKQNEQIAAKPYSYWKAVTRLLFTNWTFIICLTLLLVFIILAIVVPWGKDVIPVDRPGNRAAAPTWEHVFGLGMQGEDFWVEVWAGMRTTLLFALVLAVIQLAVGIFLGSLWGYFRKSDLFFIQVTNFLTLVPQLILLLFIIFLFKPNYWPIVLGVSLQAWIGIAATVRVQIMLVKNADYNIASISLGSRPGKIIRKNIMPKILPVVVQAGIFAIPNAISVDSSLNFLNMGFVDGSVTTSLGRVLNNVMAASEWQVYPHLILIPIILIASVSIIFFLVAKVFADSLDPKNHR